MNAFDWTIIALVALSMLFAFFRGVTRELIALVAWVLGFVAAVALTPLLGGMLPEIGNNPVLRYLLAFVAVFVGCLVLGALIAWPLATVIHKAGLGFVDRFLGAVFGARARRGAGHVLCAGLRADHPAASRLVAECRPCPATGGCRAVAEALAATGVGRASRLLPRGPRRASGARGTKGLNLPCAESSASSPIPR